MTERERLIELLKGAEGKVTEMLSRPLALEEWLGMYADHLLSNGVIVPPCKVGDTVYFPMETNGECEPYVDVGTVFAIGIDERCTMWISCRYGSGFRYYHTLDDFVKTVFLTKEEAEKALAERVKQ